jgi:hypothetical protein
MRRGLSLVPNRPQNQTSSIMSTTTPNSGIYLPESAHITVSSVYHQPSKSSTYHYNYYNNY